MNDVLELKIPAKADYIGIARLFISGVANRFGFLFNDIEDMKIAVAEACTNACKHAYDDREGHIILGCVSYEDRIEIFVIDEGQCFDVQEMKKNIGPVDQSLPIEKLNEGGLGLFLIETLMDKVEIRSDQGITIMMTKFIDKGDVANDDSSITAISP